MTENRFYQNRKGIAALGNKLGIDADSASLQFAIQNGWQDYSKEYNEWRKIMRGYQLDKKKTLADLFS